VGAIRDAFIEVDQNNAQHYNIAATAYLAQLEALDADYRQTIDTAERRTLVFGDRFPFRYLAFEYGLTCYAAFPGCSSATEPNASTIAALIDIVNQQHLPVVLYVELSNPAIADSIAAETSTQALLLNSCHNVTKKEFDSGATYLSLMRQNLEVLELALN
jgi:zinc transport system substrate-binding protein